MNTRITLAVAVGVFLAMAPAASAQLAPAAVPAGVAAPVAAVPALELPQAAPVPATPRPSRPTAVPESMADQQVPPAPPAAGVPPAAPKAPILPFPQVKGQLVNVKVEFTITEQVGSKPPTKKSMVMTVADRENGRIRANTSFAQTRGKSFAYESAPLSVDANPVIDGGRIRLDFSLEYNLYQERDATTPEDATGPKTTVSERLSAILESGVPLIIAQSSDAMSDRKLTVEVKATILGTAEPSRR